MTRLKMFNLKLSLVLPNFAWDGRHFKQQVITTCNRPGPWGDKPSLPAVRHVTVITSCNCDLQSTVHALTAALPVLVMMFFCLTVFKSLSASALAGPSTNLLQEWYAFVTESYSFVHIFLYCSPIFSLKDAIDRAQRDLSIAYTKVRITWLWRKILPKQ